MENLVIYGNGRIAKIVYQYAKEQFNVVAFTVDGDFIQESYVEGLPVLPFADIDNSHPPAEHKMLVAVGYVGLNSIREQKYDEAKGRGYQFVNYIHPSVDLHASTSIGENNIILDHVSVQPYATVGNSNFIWSNAVVAHGCAVRDNCWITSGVTIAGDSCIGSNVFIGINATVGHNISIADHTFIGANCLISRDSKEKEVYVSRDSQVHRLDSPRFMEFSGV